jgi:type IV pilus assembly protein PilC
MLFTATVTDKTGARRTLAREGLSSREVVASLRAEGYVVAAVELAEGDARREPPWWSPAWLRPMHGFDVEIGLQQLASMLKSGVSLLVALETVADQALSPRAARVWRAVQESVASGGTLSSALAAQGRRFGAAAIELVRVGEQSGELDAALLHAAQQLESQRNLRTLVLNALAYPVFAIVMAVGVCAFLVVGVIPKIAEFLESGGASLPATTQILVDVADWLRANGLAVLVVIAIAVIAFFVARMVPAGRRALDTIALRLPVAGRIQRLAGTAVFSRAMGMLVESGVTLLDSLDVVRSLLANTRLAGRVREAYGTVLRGGQLAPALKARGDFMPMLSQMVAVGETTGSLGEAFAEVARFHEMMLAVAIKRFSVAIEPVLIVITGGIVGYVYIAFFMALFSMAGVS